MLNLQVLDDEGTIRGFIQTSPGNAERTRWHIDYVAVHPESQGRGIGVKLVESVFDRYGLRGVKSFTLEVDAMNAPALRLYEKLGFRQYAQVTYMQLEKVPEVQGLPVPACVRTRARTPRACSSSTWPARPRPSASWTRASPGFRAGLRGARHGRHAPPHEARRRRALRGGGGAARSWPTCA